MVEESQRAVKFSVVVVESIFLRCSSATRTACHLSHFQLDRQTVDLFSQRARDDMPRVWQVPVVAP
jgi:hypothetical protein